MLYFLVVAKFFAITLRVRTSNSALVDTVRTLAADSEPMRVRNQTYQLELVKLLVKLSSSYCC